MNRGTDFVSDCREATDSDSVLCRDSVYRATPEQTVGAAKKVRRPARLYRRGRGVEKQRRRPASSCASLAANRRIPGLHQGGGAAHRAQDTHVRATATQIGLKGCANGEI